MSKRTLLLQSKGSYLYIDPFESYLAYVKAVILPQSKRVYLDIDPFAHRLDNSKVNICFRAKGSISS